MVAASTLREHMVERQLLSRGISEERTLDAMRTVQPCRRIRHGPKRGARPSA